MLTGLYFYYFATCCIMRLPLFCFLLSSRPKDNVQKNLWKKTLINKKYTKNTWFREGQADVMLN